MPTFNRSGIPRLSSLHWDPNGVHCCVPVGATDEHNVPELWIAPAQNCQEGIASGFLNSQPRADTAKVVDSCKLVNGGVDTDGWDTCIRLREVHELDEVHVSEMLLHQPNLWSESKGATSLVQHLSQNGVDNTYDYWLSIEFQMKQVIVSAAVAALAYWLFIQ